MKQGIRLCLMTVAVAALCGGCATSSVSNRDAASPDSSKPDALLEKDFVLEVLRHVHRWHFDQSYVLEAGKMETLEVWGRRLHPTLDEGDRSEYAELWIPAVKTLVKLKRSEYRVPEINLDIAERSFKVTRVNRQPEAPALRRHYQVREYAVKEIQDYLFTMRSHRIPLSDTLRESARRLIAEYLDRVYPAPFAVAQTFYISPLSPVCNELWVFWETGRKVMLFTADMDLTSPGFTRLSQLRMQVIDLDRDVVTSTREVPGSNAFVTKDWVGRLFFNCILYGEKLVRTPDEINQRRTEERSKPVPQ